MTKVTVPDLGEAVIALVEADQPASGGQAALASLLKPRIAGYKMPRRIVFVENLPREDSGKIRKRLLREQYANVLNEGETR